MAGDWVWGVLQVAHAIRGVQGSEVIRLISARRATTKERKRYEEETGY